LQSRSVVFASILVCFLTVTTSQATVATTQTAGPVGLAPTFSLSADPSATHVNPHQPAESNRFGPFGLFDHRSVVGTGFYPEPFLVDEGDVDREVALSWIHQEGHHAVSDDVTAEIEWSFGQLTFELEAPYERDYSNTVDPDTGVKTVDRDEGIGSPSIAARHPIWEWVSANGNVDNALIGACEVAFPSNSRVGKTTEIVPGIFDLLRVGDHFGLQIHAGYSTLYGGDENNQQTFEYSADFSYNFDATQISLPRHVVGLVPMIELAGERPLNKGDTTNDLTGVIGGRINLESFGPASPRFGVGYVFPVDKGARDDFHWGVAVSLVFDL
jgi:hypothetical protein